MANSLRLSDFLPYRLNHLAQRVSQALSGIYGERFDIAIPHWRVLATLAEHRGILARDVGLLTDMDKVRVSRAVRDLEQRGLVSRTVSASDSRAAELNLTRKGRGLYRRVAPQALAWESDLLAPLSDAERRTLFRILAKLDTQVGALDHHEP